MTSPRITIDDPPAGYRPGACNIGPAEIARRQRSGIVGVAVAAAIGVALVAGRAPRWTRWAVALPLAGGAGGLIQARLRFCAGFGYAGLQNFGPLGQEEAVIDPEARRVDRRRSVEIGIASAAVGIAGAALLAAIPA